MSGLLKLQNGYPVSLQNVHNYFLLTFSRGKNFEKGSEYANTWNKDDDGKVNTDGPRVVVGDQGGFQGQMITRYELWMFYPTHLFLLWKLNHLHLHAQLRIITHMRHSVALSCLAQVISILNE